MKLAEFKAWFEGYTENIDGAPSADQWARIKARVAEIDGVAITERVYVDRYWPRATPWQPYYGPAYAQNGAGTSGMGSIVFGAAQSVDDKKAMLDRGQTVLFDGVTAMYAAGKAEAGHA